MKKALAALLSVVFAAAALYSGFAAWLRIDGRFPFHTELNGHDVSLRRALDVQSSCMDGFYPNMRFSVQGRGGLSYKVTPQTFDFSGADRAVSFLPEHTLLWAESLFEPTSYTTRDGGALDKLAQYIEADSTAFRADLWQEPQDAYLEYDKASGYYRIIPETGGTAIDREKFETALTQHVLRGRGDLDLEDAGVYRTAEVQSSSPALIEARDKLNRFLDAEIVYRENGTEKAFSARQLLPYLTVSRDSSTITYDARAAQASGMFDVFAAELADAFDTPNAQRDFVTHDGSVVTVTERTWHAKLDVAATAQALAAMTFDELCAETVPEGRLCWEREALDKLTNYVEVDLTNQTLYLYTDGALVLETPVVSGCVAQHHTTPGGAFTLLGKHRNVTLRGPGYASFVKYWMPFNRQIGLHDASWRSRFGGTIYRTNGSHGCVNLPRDVAETIFNTIDGSYAIVCYWRPQEAAQAFQPAAAPAQPESSAPLVHGAEAIINR
ncbi:MAG: L,D-transpeptidase [Ruminococcaceae bacterium]|jgi:hypothetical protein|nr:L,D-transpeptidase [Oscillospiraceae bacterium]